RTVEMTGIPSHHTGLFIRRACESTCAAFAIKAWYTALLVVQTLEIVRSPCLRNFQRDHISLATQTNCDLLHWADHTSTVRLGDFDRLNAFCFVGAHFVLRKSA